MTRADLETRIAAYFENPTYYTVGDLSAAIQDGYDEVCAYTGILYGSATIPVSADVTYYDLITLIPDFLSLVAIFNNVTKRWLIPVSKAKLEEEASDWNTDIGSPYFFTILSHRYMALYKKPTIANYGNLFVYYKKAAPAIGSTDTFLIQDEHVRVLEQYCISDLQAQQQEWIKSNREFTAYTAQLELMRVDVQHQTIDRTKGLKG